MFFTRLMVMVSPFFRPYPGSASTKGRNLLSATAAWRTLEASAWFLKTPRGASNSHVNSAMDRSPHVDGALPRRHLAVLERAHRVHEGARLAGPRGPPAPARPGARGPRGRG